MKVAMLGAWNTDSGASIHAELVGRAWKKMGIDLEVFTFYRRSFHGTALTKRAKDEEDYVNRCFTVYGIPNAEMNTEPILRSDFDIFVAQDLGMVPMRDLLAIFPEIKKKAKTINVIHDCRLSDKPEFFKFNWDHVVCFDQRYYDFLKVAYPEGRLSIIPYPSYPYAPRDKDEAREALGLPKEKKIVLVFGQAAGSALNTTLALDRLAKKYDIMLLLVTEVEIILQDFKLIKDKVDFEMKIVERSPDMELLYDYLHASDCMIYNKHSVGNLAVVGSTVFQCMGSGCPIVSLESNFVYPFNKEVIKYRNFYELEESLIDIFEKGPKYQENQKAVVDYLEDKSAEPTAERFIKLFESVLQKG